MDNIEEIKRIVEKNNGILFVKDLEINNIHRQYLKKLEETGYLRKISRGIYLKKGKEVNEFFIIGEKYKKGIFSHNTALYFYDLTDRTPLRLDMTFPSYITVHNDSIKTHYIKEEQHLLGVEEMKLNDGTTIRIYNMERTICDIIRDRNKMESQVFNTAMKEYCKRKNKNFKLLYKYAKEFRIENKLKQYMEVLD